MLPTAKFRRFNAYQLHALDTRRNLAVRANAGSGKTSVLVERIVQLLARSWAEHPPLALGAVVAITFTRKAAAELQERLQESFRERVREAVDEREQVYWAGLVEEIPRAVIGTIDSFCARILREFGFLEGPAERIEPDFEPLEAYDAQILKREAVDRVINRLSATGRDAAGQAFQPDLQPFPTEEAAQAEACHWWATTQGYDALTRHLMKLLAHPVDPELIIAAQRDLPPAADQVEEQWASHPAVQTLVNDRDALRQQLQDLVLTIQAAKRPPAALLKFRDALTLVLQGLEGSDREHTEAALRALKDALLTDAGTPRKQGLSLVEEQVRPLQDAWHALLSGFTFNYEAERWALEAADRLVRLFEPVYGEYLQLCHEANRFDFLTIARRARDLLARSPRIRETLQARYRYVMVDEFQDTNQLQWEIISWLVGAGPDGPLDTDRLFIVGDPQQSIYRFRHADVSIFARVEQQIRADNQRRGLADLPTDYDNHTGAFTSDENQRLGSMPLAENYRTLSPAPLKLLDHVFRHVFDPEVHGLDLEHNTFEVRYQPLEAGLRPPPGAAGEVRYVIPRDAAGGEGDEEPEGEPAEEGAAGEALGHRPVVAVVDQLAALHGQPMYTGGPDATLSWKDMAVLLPSRTVVLTELEKEFRQRHIPFVVTRGIGFWQRQEVRDVVNLATCLADPGDELALFGVLRGPLGLLTDTEILFLSQLGLSSLVRGLRIVSLAGASLFVSEDNAAVERSTRAEQCSPRAPREAPHAEREGYTAEARPVLEEVWQAFPDEAKDRLRTAARRLAVWRQRVDRLADADLLQRALEESGAYAVYGAEAEGEVILANLARMFDIIRAEEARSAPGLARLTRKLRRQMDEAFQEEQATLAPGQDAVQVMTVHAAKGLEFPVVAVLKMERRADRGSYPRLMVVGPTDIVLKEDAQDLPEPRAGTVTVSVRHPRRPREMYTPRLLKALHRLDVAQQLAESRRLFYVAATRAKERLILAGKPPRLLASGGVAKMPVSWQKWFEEALGLTDAHKQRQLWDDPARGFRVAIVTEAQGGGPVAEIMPEVPTEPLALQTIHEGLRVPVVTATTLLEMLPIWRRDQQEWWLRYQAHVSPSPGLPAPGTHPSFAGRSLGQVVGVLVHRLLELGDAAPRPSGRSLQRLVETLAVNLLSAPPAGAQTTASDWAPPVAPAALRAAADATLRVAENLRRETPGAQAVRRLLTAAGEVEVDWTLRLGGWLVIGRFDKLLTTAKGLEMIGWQAAPDTAEPERSQITLAALALYRSGRAALSRGMFTAHLVRWPELQVETLRLDLPELEALAAELEQELSFMTAYGLA